MRGDIKGQTAAAWQDWAAQKHKPEPPVEPVWLDDTLPLFTLVSLANAALAGEEDALPYIIWYEHHAVGDLLQAKGIPTFGAGRDAEVANETQRPKVRTIALSIWAHSTGKNLQAWSRAVVLCPPSAGDRWEQMIGRLHRPGQQADEVRFAVNASSDWYRDALVSAVQQARYVNHTAGSKQRILDAALLDWPTI
jgi:hypothetical protein